MVVPLASSSAFQVLLACAVRCPTAAQATFESQQKLYLHLAGGGGWMARNRGKVAGSSNWLSRRSIFLCRPSATVRLLRLARFCHRDGSAEAFCCVIVVFIGDAPVDVASRRPQPLLVSQPSLSKAHPAGKDGLPEALVLGTSASPFEALKLQQSNFASKRESPCGIQLTTVDSMHCVCATCLLQGALRSAGLTDDHHKAILFWTPPLQLGAYPQLFAAAVK
eukprot:CAMPEP_0172663476 /NCGR_PEP_ID=MMETSP1074-20121228/5952_1 /TAXON_ID=2916 /ORGANISM="Ceratium fusus, Strain PA161109" /LENGTH=221 /DNA_ID=CAMNT_0013479481 /DNA_START=35 /DNA_END=701 /DNA_ORIENTATION=+